MLRCCTLVDHANVTSELCQTMQWMECQPGTTNADTVKKAQEVDAPGDTRGEKALKFRKFRCAAQFDQVKAVLDEGLNPYPKTAGACHARRLR